MSEPIEFERPIVKLRVVNYIHDVFTDGKWVTEAYAHEIQYCIAGDTQWRGLEVINVRKEEAVQ